MSRPTIAPAILSQRGHPLTLLDWSTGDHLPVTLCYTFGSLLAIEEQFGSLQKALDALDTVNNKDAKAFAAIAGLLAAGLEHEAVGPNGDHLADSGRIRNYMDPADLGVYGEAIGKAITAAFPSAEEGEETTDPPMDSPGSPGITSPPSSGDGLPTSSGGQHLLSSTP